MNILSPEELKNIGEIIEKRIKKTKSIWIIMLGLCFVSLSLLFFLFSFRSAGTRTIWGYEMIFEFHLITAWIFFILHVLTLIILIIPRFPDKFQFSTLFCLICLPTLFFMHTVEAKLMIPKYPDHSAGLDVGCLFMLLFSWILFGLEAYKSKPVFILFKAYAALDQKIQYYFDHYGNRDFRESFKRQKKNK